MLGSNVLEIAIGMLLIYSILSLICSAITEFIAEQLMSMRSKKLNKWIREALEDQNLINLIYEHPLIRTLRRGNGSSTVNVRNLPAYIPAQTFALALFDVATHNSQTPPTGAGGVQSYSLNDFMGTIQNMNEGYLKTLLLSLTHNIGAVSAKEEEKLRAAWMNIETWFDNVMEQATAEYKRLLKWFTLVIAIFVCLAVNADSLMLVNALANDPAVRNVVVAEASKFVTNPPTDVQTTAAADENPGEPPPLPSRQDTIERLQQDLTAIGLFGWTPQGSSDRRAIPNFTDFYTMLSKFIGLAVTIFAISLGAPFWFDLLNKLVNLRTTGAKPAKAAETESETDNRTASTP